MENNAQKLNELLRLSPRLMSFFGVAIEYLNPTVPVSMEPRLDQDEVVRMEIWGRGRQKEHIDECNKTLKAIYCRQGKPHHGPCFRHAALKIASGKLDRQGKSFSAPPRHYSAPPPRSDGSNRLYVIKDQVEATR